MFKGRGGPNPWSAEFQHGLDGEWSNHHERFTSYGRPLKERDYDLKKKEKRPEHRSRWRE